MRAQQSLWTAHSGWTGDAAEAADLLLVFGGATPIKDETHWHELSRRHPKAIRLGCSTGGEIHGRNVLDESLSVTALSFDRTILKPAETAIADAAGSYQAGVQIGEQLAAADLRAI